MYDNHTMVSCNETVSPLEQVGCTVYRYYLLIFDGAHFGEYVSERVA